MTNHKNSVSVYCSQNISNFHDHTLMWCYHKNTLWSKYFNWSRINTDLHGYKKGYSFMIQDAKQ